MAKPIKLNYELKNRKEATTLLSVTFTWKSKRNKISLGFKINPDDWDTNSNRVIVHSKQTQSTQRKMKRVNRFLDDFEKQVAAIKVEWIEEAFAYSKDVEVIPNKIRNIIERLHGIEQKEEEKKKILPLDYFAKVIEEMPHKVVKRTSKFIDTKTVGHHHIVLKRVIRFLVRHNLQDRGFDVFDKNFETIMERWMLEECGYSPNTVCATFSVMKVWLNHAEEDNLITDKSFHAWKSKGRDVQHIYLNEAELRKIYNLQFTDEFKRANKIDPNSSIEQTRDIFIIASQIGLRYGDMGSLNSANWDLTNKTVEIHTHKTGESVTVPLSSFVMELYAKYEGKFPKPIDKSKFNSHLTKICKLAGVNESVNIQTNVGGKVVIKKKEKSELVSSHTARRSFATNLYLKCKDARMVMAFTGHKTEENFRKYICIEKLEMARMAAKYFD